MLFRNGSGKFTDVFINGDSWEKAYLNGGLIFQKGQSGGNYATIWYKDDNNVTHEKSIDYYTDLENLCSTAAASTYTITLSDGTTFRNNQVIDFTLGNATNFPNSFPANFGHKWTNLSMGSESGDTEIVIPDNVTALGDGFLEGSSYNLPLDLNNVRDIGNDFLNEAYQFNSAIAMDSVRTIGNYFMAECTVFNKSLTFPASLLSIGTDFMQRQTGRMAFNSAIDFSACTSLVSIGARFMQGGTSSVRLAFTGTLNLANCSSLTSVGEGFLDSSLATGLVLPSGGQTCHYGNGFCNQARAISHFTFPAGTVMDGNWLGIIHTYSDGSLTHITCNCDVSSWPAEIAISSTSSCVEYAYNSSGPDISRLTAVLCDGTHANDLMAKYPSGIEPNAGTSSTFYGRKWRTT